MSPEDLRTPLWTKLITREKVQYPIAIRMLIARAITIANRKSKDFFIKQFNAIYLSDKSLVH